MAEFLSPAWLAALDAALRASGPAAVDAELVVEEVVRGGPRGDVVYHVVVGPAGSRVVPGPAPAPDVTVVVEHVTAVALARGSTNAQRALAEGGLHLRGRLGALVAAHDALAVVGDAFAAVRAATAFPDADDVAR